VLTFSRTADPFIVVRGTASDADSLIEYVRVHRVDAASTDEFATWTASVPLEPGENTLELEVADRPLNVASDLDQRDVKGDAMLGLVSGMAWDSVNDRLLTVDTNSAGVIAIDPATGLKAVVSNSVLPDSNQVVVNYRDIVLDGLGCSEATLQGEPIG
jgi:hypothetical protein